MIEFSVAYVDDDDETKEPFRRGVPLQPMSKEECERAIGLRELRRSEGVQPNVRMVLMERTVSNWALSGSTMTKMTAEEFEEYHAESPDHEETPRE